MILRVMTPVEIADLIDRLKGNYALSAIGLALTVNENAEDLMCQAGVSVKDSIRVSRSKGYDKYELPIAPYVQGPETAHAQQKAMVQSWLELSILHVGHQLAANSYFDRAPVLKFFRHIRNGVAHGNRMNVLPVKKKGKEQKWTDVVWRTFVIKLYMDAAAIGGVLRGGDALMLLDDVADHLRSLKWVDGKKGKQGQWVATP